MATNQEEMQLLKERAKKSIRNSDTFEDFNLDEGWADWMELYTEAQDGEGQATEAELKDIDSIMRGVWEDALSEEWDQIVGFMDRDICEELHNELAPCTKSEFYDAYLQKHECVYDAPFTIG